MRSARSLPSVSYPFWLVSFLSSDIDILSKFWEKSCVLVLALGADAVLDRKDGAAGVNAEADDANSAICKSALLNFMIL